MNGYTGQRIPRFEDRRLATGRGRYTDDINLPGTLHLAFVRSPHAHARIVQVDGSAAAAHPGAALVLTGDDLDGNIAPFWSGFRSGPFRQAHVWPLARGRVRMVGEPVAAVVSTSRYLAEDIAERITTDYEPLSAVASASAALAHDSLLLYEDWADNLYGELRFSTPRLQEAFAGAAHVVRRRVSSGRSAAVPLEPRGCVAEYSPGADTLTVHMGHQDVHMARQILAALLGMAPNRVRVVSPDVGGAFGAKMPVYREEMVACVASRLLGLPVKWIQDRREGLLADAHAREMTVEAEMALDAAGRILGVKARIVSDAGAYALAGRGPSPEAVMVASELTGPYHVPEYGYHAQIVMTNKSPLGICRGVGGPLAVLTMETLLNAAAKEMGIDPVAIRRRNLIDSFPYSSPTGYCYDSGAYRELLERLLTVADFAALHQQIEAWRAEGRLVGVGLSVMNEATTRSSVYGPLGLPVSSQEGCHLQMDPAGYVLARFGTTNQGQGLHTALAAVIADDLGLPLGRVRVEMGDTETAPYGGGVWGSRGGTAAGAAARIAAGRLRAKLEIIAVHRLEARSDELEWADGMVSVRSSNLAISYAELAQIAYFRANELPPGVEPGLDVLAHWEPELRATFASAAHLAVVEIDRRTAALKILRWVIVEDCGTILNEGLAEGQLQGGLAQGIGLTAYEQLVYDESGQLLTATLMDYLLPTAHEVPTAEIHHVQTPSTHNPLGSRGVAESGTVAAPATLASAIADALGTEVTDLPVTSDKLFHLIFKNP